LAANKYLRQNILGSAGDDEEVERRGVEGMQKDGEPGCLDERHEDGLRVRTLVAACVGVGVVEGLGGLLV
jgi:hypothetical protein